jgi:pimeloyl-ACP methyl ester carboxylesterase
MSQGYAQLALPVEILHGTADTIVPASVHALPLSAVLPDATLTLLPGIGHMPHHADPAAVVAAIDRAAARARLR